MESRFFSSLVTFLVFSSLSLSPWLAFAGRPATSGNQKCCFPAIFNFGDSNSDTGGLSAVFGQAPPPHGMTFFGGPAGRYCDGRVIVDFIAEHFGLPYTSPYLSAIGTDLNYGANFATAGSTIRPQNTTFHDTGFSPISLDVQWNEFYDFHTRSQVVRNHSGVYQKLLPKNKAAYRDILPPIDVFNNGLYTFDIGQNDLTAGYFLNKTTDEVREYVPEVVNKLKDIISWIYGLGGRSFWIHNTGPVGCLPYVFERIPVLASQVDKAGCAIPFNDVAQYFNSKLKEAVAQLRQEFPLGAFTYVDIYKLKYTMFHDGAKHGFTETIKNCCGFGGRYNFNLKQGCGSTEIVNGTQVVLGKACDKPGEYVVWDGVHFTEAANKFIYNNIVSGAYSDPPVPLDMACHRMD
ncbi:alpha-L-fucosidase 3-like [Pistacia vera]|uniref:alpha-L-fucosidase 3-like n=1 Tax=Pistacia vera TaxID=55513 RepID=UPI0012639974|nr:alpha-L-fucosidase 3-like [Pistacia vera]